MELTRIMQLTMDSEPGLYLLGGEYYLDGDVSRYTPSVWELQRNRTSHSYHWDYEFHPPMGGLHLLYSPHTPPYREGVC